MCFSASGADLSANTIPMSIGNSGFMTCWDYHGRARVATEFWDLWPEIIRELEAKGIRAGPESFQSWNDGDAGLVRAIWCLTRHLRPKKVVETGVAHGVTSRFILEALKRNGDGHLWCIDLPPIERVWRRQVGVRGRR